LVQYVIQKCLAKSLVHKSPLAELFREKTSKESIDLILAFINNGSSLDIRVFDEIIYYSLQLLSSCYRYFLIHSVMGQVLHHHYSELISEGHFVSASMIQCLYRKNKATRRVQLLLKEKRDKEDKARLDEEIRLKLLKEREEAMREEKIRQHQQGNVANRQKQRTGISSLLS
jgi:hypothetical protein